MGQDSRGSRRRRRHQPWAVPCNVAPLSAAITVYHYDSRLHAGQSECYFRSWLSFHTTWALRTASVKSQSGTRPTALVPLSTPRLAASPRGAALARGRQQTGGYDFIPARSVFALAAH